MTMLCIDYTTPANAAKDAQALHEFAAVAIPAERLTAHTAVTLLEEEVAVHPQLFPHCLYVLSVLYILIHGAFAVISTFPRLLTRCFLKGPHRTPQHTIWVTSPTSSHRASPNLGQHLSREHTPSSYGLSNPIRGATLLQSSLALRRPR